MGSSIQYCIRHKLVSPPDWLETNLQYECIMGSQAYGCATKGSSDYDIYGFAIPRKSVVFPHTAGYIPGFDNDYPRFEQWQQHGIEDKSGGKQFDFTVFSIIKYFSLLIDNNPNIIDSLFVPENCIKHITAVGQLVRDNRRLFLSKLAWPRFRGYASSQFHKLEIKEHTGKRAELVEKFGYDTKYAYHIIRLLSEVEQMLTVGDLNLTKNNNEFKAIRKGEWSYERLCSEFEQRKLALEAIYAKSDLQDSPPRDKIRSLLLQCLEMHYGSIADAIAQNDLPVRVLQEIDKQLIRVRNLL